MAKSVLGAGVDRIYQAVIKEHFARNRQMAFVSGPRQVGKTTIAKNLMAQTSHALYRTWDTPGDQVRILAASYDGILEGLALSPATHPLLILDEIHKFADWKNYLKGFFDLYQGQMDILITGSARLNVFTKGNDSLMGRYFLYRAHPLSVGELNGPGHKVTDGLTSNLLEFGGFPEPFYKNDKRFFNQWQNLRRQQLIYEDIRSLEAIQNLAQLELLASLLQYQVGQLVNYSTLATKVRVSVPTIQRWLSVLEQFYYCFMIRPWSTNISRSLIKEPKIYLYDWSLVTDIGSKHENFVASHLLKAANYWTDIGRGQYELFFIRTKDQAEVDFLLTKDRAPWMLVEVKSSTNSALSKSLKDYQQVLNCPMAFQVVFDLKADKRSLEYTTQAIDTQQAPANIVPAESLLAMLV